MQNNIKKSSTVIFAGGGTGGHIYPGIALAQKLEDVSPDYKSVFIGSGKALEAKILSQTNYDLKTTSVKPFNQGGVLLKLKSLLWHLPISTVQAVFLLIKLKPKWVLSLGSYAAVPVGIAAFFLRIPLFTWEPNAKAGLANRLLSYFSKTNFVVFMAVELQLKGQCIKVGLPLRKEFKNKINNLQTTGEELGKPSEKLKATGEELGKPSEKLKATGEELGKPPKSMVFSDTQAFKILILGGSLGSDFLNSAICKLWPCLYDQPLSIIHQTGSRYIKKTQEDYKTHDHSNLKYKVVEYLDSIEQEYHWANLVIARAGIGTLFELAACKKASLLVPYSLSADNHQVKNAKTLADNKQAIMIEEKHFSIKKVETIIRDFIKSPEKLVSLETNITSFYNKNTEALIIESINKIV